MLYFPDLGASYTLITLGDNEFLYSDGSRVIFTMNEAGDVVGYRIWVSLVHPIGGQWYEAVRLGD